MHKQIGYVDTSALLSESSLPQRPHSRSIAARPYEIKDSMKIDLLLMQAAGLRIGSSELNEIVEQITERS